MTHSHGMKPNFVPRAVDIMWITVEKVNTIVSNCQAVVSQL